MDTLKTPNLQKTGTTPQKETTRRFARLLVANRGEIAIRVFRAATELGIRTVAIFSEEDKTSLHRYKADEAYQIGKGLGPLRAYLAIDEIIDLAKEKKVDAIHPGYGFLSENAAFAEACERAGIAFVGPRSKDIALMGNKVAAREAAVKIGLPVVPGVGEPIAQLSDAVRSAQRIGYPVMLKSVFGGGGRGMRVARSETELRSFFPEAQSEAKTAFGRPEVFVEKLIERPKHIEVQILGDHYGNVVHCFERDCSIQRRHQKVIELAPAPTLLRDARSMETRESILTAAVELARSVGYYNAGTVEFLFEPEKNRFYFMEMNTRIQVEHTVSEMITGIDLVKTQIRIAEGHPLSSPEIGIATQDDVQFRGCAIQCRITTEDPSADFVPDYGRLTAYRSAAGHGVRLDAGSAHDGAVITPFYDSLLVKLTTFGRHLKEAAQRMDRALAEFRIRGVKTNINFLRSVTREPEFLGGDFRTDYLERHPELKASPDSQDRASKLLQFIAEVTVNGNPAVKDRPRPARTLIPVPPDEDKKKPFLPGTKQILEEKGPEGLVKWIQRQEKLLITDTTFRDAHQSLLATRVRTYDMLAVARGLAKREPGFFSYEMWGGATFDAALTFLQEDPWERLRALRKAIPNSLLQMLIRGDNLVGYTSYPKNIVERFVRLAAENGVDLFRIFDAFNQVKNIRAALDAVREQNRIAEPAICYTGNVEDPRRSKYSLSYYVKLAKELEKAGAHILAIKDMAGLLRPYSARLLIKALRDEISIPIHLHTHDTTGIQAATLVAASESGVNIVDAALASMSGITSQVNLNSLVAAFEHHKRRTELDLPCLNEYSTYWEDARRNYFPFEPDLFSSSADVYFHEMPGGQYTNLRAQAEAMGLGPRWKDVVKAYSMANRLFGDIIKVTPSSKVVGDMALFMVANQLNEKNFLEKSEALSFPRSVIGMMEGDLGFPPGGFPPAVRDAILKRKGTGRAPVHKPLDLERLRADLEQAVERNSKRRGSEVQEQDLISFAMHPQPTLNFLSHKVEYGNTSLLPTPIFFFGMRPGEETAIQIEEGKVLYVKLIAVSDADPQGVRSLFFELNGYPRDIQVFDKSKVPAQPKKAKADPDNLHHVGAPMPGRVLSVPVHAGKSVQKGEKLFVMEAMKMETSVISPRSGVISEILVKEGDSINSGDLIIVFR